jgi:hypothetical protein
LACLKWHLNKEAFIYIITLKSRLECCLPWQAVGGKGLILHANALAVVETKMLQVILPTRTKIGRKLKLVLTVKNRAGGLLHRYCCLPRHCVGKKILPF